MFLKRDSEVWTRPVLVDYDSIYHLSSQLIGYYYTALGYNAIGLDCLDVWRLKSPVCCLFCLLLIQPMTPYRIL